MLSEREPGLPGGTSELNDIAEPPRTSVHWEKRAEREASSNFSTKTTSGWVSMPTSPGKRAARPPTGGGGTLLETVTVTPAEVVLFPAASRATAVRVWLPLLAV